MTRLKEEEEEEEEEEMLLVTKHMPSPVHHFVVLVFLDHINDGELCVPLLPHLQISNHLEN